MPYTLSPWAACPECPRRLPAFRHNYDAWITLSEVAVPLFIKDHGEALLHPCVVALTFWMHWRLWPTFLGQRLLRWWKQLLPILIVKGCSDHSSVSTWQGCRGQPSLWEAGISTVLSGRTHMLPPPPPRETFECPGKPYLEQRCSRRRFDLGYGHYPSREVTRPCGWVSWILILVGSFSSSLTYPLADGPQGSLSLSWDSTLF